MSTLTSRATINNLALEDQALSVLLSDGRRLHVPLGAFPRLADASASQLSDWRLIGAGDGVHWEQLDEDISVRALERSAREEHQTLPPQLQPSLDGESIAHWLRRTITALLQERPVVAALACQNRATFARWLQFEVSEALQRAGAARVLLGHADSSIAFYLGSARYDLDLKTWNTSWRTPGTVAGGRPTSQRVERLISNAATRNAGARCRLFALLLFPIPTGNAQWKKSLTRLSEGLRLSLTESENATVVPVSLAEGLDCEVAVITFPYPPE